MRAPSFDELRDALASLPLDGYRLATRRKMVSGISALKFDVEVTEPQPERHLPRDPREIVRRASALSASVKDRAIAIFEVLAEAEAKVHHTTPEHVHFHEVGAVDSIIDIVGAAWGSSDLELGELMVSPLPMGSGFARSQHGIIPVPAPATAELLAGFPVRMGDGAPRWSRRPARRSCARWPSRPRPRWAFEIEHIGYGAGTKEFADRPNVLRLMVGERAQVRADLPDRRAARDLGQYRRPQSADLRPCDRAAVRGRRARRDADADDHEEGPPRGDDRGARRAADTRAIAEVLFAETSTIGLRFHPVARLKLTREIREVETRWGRIRVKISRGDGATVTMSPEYDDCSASRASTRSRSGWLWNRRRRPRAGSFPKMIDDRLRINEIFFSIQGEST